MDPLVALIVVVLLAAVVAVLWAPLRGGRGEEPETGDAERLADLEAEKEARYREIRDAELDRRTGKLAEDDWRAIDRQLRAEAVAILGEIDRLGG